MHLFPPLLQPQMSLSLSLLKTYLTVGSSALLWWTPAHPLRQRHARTPLHCPTMRGQVNKGQRKAWVRSHSMPRDACWQESSWRRGLGPARVDGTNHPESDERKWGLQTLLLKSFAEKLSAKKTELMIAIMSMKNCFLLLGFIFLNTGFWRVFFVCLFWNFWPHL